MPLAGAAAGAQDALQALLTRAFEEEQMRQQMALREQAQTQQEREFTANEAYRAGQVARQTRLDDVALADRRQEQNKRGVQRMLGDFLMQRGSTPLDQGARNQLMGMGLSEGIDVPRALTDAPESKLHNLGPGARLVDDSGKVIASSPVSQRDDRLVQVMGPDGTPIWARESDAVGKPATQAARAVTGQERKVLGFFQRMLEAERNARSVEEQLTDQDFAAEYLPGEWLENMARTKPGQQYAQAQRMYTEGRLRKESGAAINKDEYDKDRTTNFRRPSDSPEVLKQKRAARLVTLRGAGNEAGRALQEFYGPEATLDSLLSEFAEKSSAPERRPIPGIPGGIAELRDGKWIRVQ